MNNAENEEVMIKIINEIIQVVRTEEQLDKFYDLMPPGLRPKSEPLKSPFSPSVKSVEEGIAREIKATIRSFRRLQSSQREWAVNAVLDAMNARPVNACCSRPAVALQDVCSEIPDAPLPATAEFWRGYRAGAQAQGAADAEAILNSGLTVVRGVTLC